MNPSRDPRRWWEDDDDYWFHEDIHTLGNTGLTGGLHAAMAPLSTRIIDLVAYKGKNIRKTVSSTSSRREERMKCLGSASFTHLHVLSSLAHSLAKK
jgi:hypothetical protein